MPRKTLGVFEIELLSALLKTGRQNYALVIARTVSEETGRPAPSLGAVYTAMERLIKKGFVTSYWSEPDPALSNRRKRLYKIEAQGMEALVKARSAQTQSTTAPFGLGARA